MKIETLRLLFDFGLTVLVWMVQLVVYPSFIHYSKSGLLHWHRLYVVRIAYVVIPLMLGQLVISGWLLFSHPSLYNGIGLLAVLFLWGFTFTHFAPLHRKISNDEITDRLLKKLVVRNWLRTLVWTLLLVYGIIRDVL